MEKRTEHLRRLIDWVRGNLAWFVIQTIVSIAAPFIPPILEFVMRGLNVNTVLAGIILALAVFGGLTVLALLASFVWNRFQKSQIVPKKSDDDLLARADKYTWNDVGITVDKNIMPNSIGLLVSNNKPFDIQEACAMIVYIERAGQPLLRDDPSGPKRGLGWYKEVGGHTWNPKKLARKGQPASTRSLIVAMFNKPRKRAFLHTINRGQTPEIVDDIRLDLGVSYRIRINWLGEVAGRKMDEYATDYWIVFKGDDIKMTLIQS